MIFETSVNNINDNEFLLTKSLLNSKINKQYLILSGIKINTDWSWDESSKSECVSLSSNNKSAYFFDNPFTISRGTAGVRGNKPLNYGVQYFEILIKEPLYGTSVMIGFGTEDALLHYENFDYVNLIGIDSNSWGLSHKGVLWHNGISSNYCPAFFDKNTRVGVLLNNYNKSLHYFLNGNYLGVAFKNINPEDKNLYPIMSSTATDIEIEIVDSFKLVSSLQDLCCQSICKKCENFDTLPIAKRLIGRLKHYSINLI